MSRPKGLDLFCGAGGASMGYHRAGFEMTGVDNRPQPRYPFRFIHTDALDYVTAHGHEYDAVFASPPCQRYSEATPVAIRATLPDLIGPTRDALQALGVPYVIENVENARRHLINPVMLCGTMFGMSIWRHRYFETHPFWCLAPASCLHIGRPISLHPGSNARKGRGDTSVAVARVAMGIDWMSKEEIHEAIPPAYTEFIGRQLLPHAIEDAA